MTCDCNGAPYLSGPGFGNLTKRESETVESWVEWCAQVPEGGTLLGSNWAVTPDTVLTPLVAGSQGTQGTQAGALISGGTQGQLYKAVNTVGVQGPQGPQQNLSFTLWVYVPLEPAPDVFEPCDEG